MEKEDFIQKIKLQKALHSYYEMRRRVVAIIVKTLLIILPAIITFLAMADLSVFFKDDYTEMILIYISIIAFILFIISILSEVFEFEVRHKLHRSAMNQLIRLRDNYLNELIEKGHEKEIEVTRKYRDIYLEIVQNSPEFTDSQYFKGKKYYIKRLKMKEELNTQIQNIFDNQK